LDDLDAHGHIYTDFLSAGGRKVAGSNPVAPTTRLAALPRDGLWRYWGEDPWTWRISQPVSERVRTIVMR
jgi:hypothetical protein